jgi:hypothetical protein
MHLQSVHPDVVLPIEGTVADGYLSVVPGDTMALDAFGRQRVSNPVGVHASQLEYDLDRILWENKITDNSGSATVTHQANRASAYMTVGANDTIIRQSRKYLRYQAGKSQKIAVTCVPGAPEAGIIKRFGYFDGNNGLYFEINGTDLYCVRRTNVTGTPEDNRDLRVNWLDPLDGSGASGFTLDLSKSQIFWVDLEWLGVGRTRCGFQINGQYIEIMKGNNTNVLDSVYMTTANLPVRYEVSASAGYVGTNTLEAICSEVSSEGGAEYPNGKTFSAANETTLISVSTTLIPLLSIRPKSTFNSVVNRGLIIPSIYSSISVDQIAYMELIWGGTLTDPSWSSVNADSIVEYDVSASAISGGVTVDADYISAGSGRRQAGVTVRDATVDYPLFLDIDGNHPTSPHSDALTVAAVSTVAQSTNCGATLGWKEVR